MNSHYRAELIATLAADLEPVRPLRPATGWLVVAAAAVVTAGIIALFMGMPQNLLASGISSYLLIANGLLLVLGLSATAAVLTMASPAVGPRNDGPKWAIGMAATFPAAAIVLLLREAGPAALLGAAHDWACALTATGASVLVAASLVFWLKRGAAVSLNRAGIYVGVAAGALGSAIYGLSCPLGTFYHLGIWHFLPVLAWALIGAVAVPRLVRW